MQNDRAIARGEMTIGSLKRSEGRTWLLTLFLFAV
jgi:hypothetical protein